MEIAIAKETKTLEKRVAATPETVKKFISLGTSIKVEKDAGIAYINGKDIHTRSKEIRSITGYMSQNIDLDDELSIFENLIINGRLHGLNYKTAKNNS